MANHEKTSYAWNAVARPFPGNGKRTRLRRRRARPRWTPLRAPVPRNGRGKPYEHSYCFLCSTYFYDTLLTRCIRCGGSTTLLTGDELRSFGLLRRMLAAEVHYRD